MKMTERTANQLKEIEGNVLQYLKVKLEHNGDIMNDPESYGNIWIMALSIPPYSHNLKESLPACLDGSQILNPEQVFLIRVVLRTTTLQGSNIYVDGTTLCITIDSGTEKIEILMEDAVFSDAPEFQGGPLPSAIKWISVLSEPCYLQFKDPFLTSEQRIALNGHDEDYILPEPKDKLPNPVQTTDDDFDKWF
ncbi:hypothetical protein SAMN03159341_12269 [Paenibacillus sp. 1_12]|uniref:hypothetical protein n=1 Tax=Paenibacillus sp. 1_12 TaxID=1566278 RepID=UPI0008EB7260|nr:hypothetical protein [Paenibacillus sp. 1_12]SFM25481.1 hypothetical protein SAMN03159341_12269 [Paenibacillus sp. 1_12]